MYMGCHSTVSMFVSLNPPPLTLSLPFPALLYSPPHLPLTPGMFSISQMKNRPMILIGG